jgi:hypothetical protein
MLELREKKEITIEFAETLAIIILVAIAGMTLILWLDGDIRVPQGHVASGIIAIGIGAVVTIMAVLNRYIGRVTKE